jgi:hypothetical protein
MNAEQNQPELHEDSTPEEVAAYIKARPQLFADVVEFEGMSLCLANPDLVQPADGDDQDEQAHRAPSPPPPNQLLAPQES